MTTRSHVLRFAASTAEAAIPQNPKRLFDATRALVLERRKRQKQGIMEPGKIYGDSWLGRRLRPWKPYKAMSRLELSLRRVLEEYLDPRFLKVEKRMLQGGLAGVVGALYASVFPALDGIEATVDKMTPDVLVTSAYVQGLSEQDIQKFREGQIPMKAGESITAKLPDGSTIELAVEEKTDNVKPGKPPELKIVGRINGGPKTGLEGRTVQLVFDEEDVYGLLGASPILTEDMDDTTKLAHLVDRDAETKASRAHAKRNLPERVWFALCDQKYNWGWAFSAFGGLLALLAALKLEMSSNLTPAEKMQMIRARLKRIKQMQTERAKPPDKVLS